MGEPVALGQQVQYARYDLQLVSVADHELHRAAARGNKVGEIFALDQLEPFVGSDRHLIPL